MHQTELFRNFLAVGAGGAVGAMLRYGMTVDGLARMPGRPEGRASVFVKK